MIRNYRALCGQWCVEGLRATLRGQTAHFRSFPVAITLQDSLDAKTFLARLGSHLGCPAPTDDDEAEIQQAVDRVLQTLCDSLQSGSVYFIELFIKQTASLCDNFLPWLLEQFWVPLVMDWWPGVLDRTPLAVILLIIEIDPPVQPARIPTAPGSSPTVFDGTRIVELPLQKWTRQEIETWLLRFSGLTSSPSDKTVEEVRSLAAQIYTASRGGTPEAVYAHFLQELPRDERLALGGLI